LLWTGVRNKKVVWAVLLAGIAATTGIAGYGVALSGWNRVTPTKPSFYTESLHATYMGYGGPCGPCFRVNIANNGNLSVTTTGGTCSSGYCLLQPPEISLDKGSNITVDFDGAVPNGPVVFNVTIFQGNKTYSWNTSSSAFNPRLGHETLILDSFDRYIPFGNAFYYYLNLTNTGPNNVDITGGNCTNTSCAAASPIVLSPNVVTRVEFTSFNPCPGNITLNATTIFDNTFNFYVKAC
jgi:hypothetical protein